MHKLDMYITEINNSETNKIIKSGNIEKIVSMLSNMDDEGKDRVINLLDKGIRKQIIKMREGGLL